MRILIFLFFLLVPMQARAVTVSDCSFTNPGADRLFYWKHSSSDCAIATLGQGLSLSGDTVSVNYQLSSNDAAALGASGTAFSDLYLASGSVINWNAGDVLLTHSANALAFTGAGNGYTFDNAVAAVRFVAANGSASAGTIRWVEDQSNGTHYFALTGAESMAANVDCTLPVDDGTEGQVLTTDGGAAGGATAGCDLTWEDAAAGGGDSVSIDGAGVTDPDFVSTGDIDFVNTSNTITANINADVVAAAEMADADHGDVAWSGGVASVEDVSCTDCLNATQIEDIYLLKASLGTGVETFLGTPSSSNFFSAVTGETGSGAVVGGTSPTIATPTFTGAVTLSEGASVALDPAGSADGAYSGITITGTSGYSQAFGDLVYLDPTDSRWEAVDANAASGADGDARGIIGMVVVAGTDGNACTILLQGTIRADAAFPTFTVNAPIYASETAGDVTNTMPTTTDNVIRVIGFGLTGNDIYFNPSQDWITHI